MLNILKEIEKKYPVDKIYLNNEQIWPIFKANYYFILKYYSENFEIGGIRKKTFFQKLILVKNIFYGWKKWFKKYDYIATSTSRVGVSKIINGKYYNRLIDPIIDEMKNNNILYIERPYGKHYNKKIVHEKNIVSYYPIVFISYLFDKLSIHKYNLNGSEILNSIKKDYNIKINYDKLIKFYLAEYRVFKFIFQHIKPKAIFIVNYTGYFGVIKAAKELGIKIIEVQHGIIGREHPAYNFGIKISKNLFPDYLFVYGKQDVMNFSESYFIDQKNVIPIGSYYIDYLKESFLPDIKFKNIINKYRISVGITLQNTVEKQTIDFVKEAAILDSSILFILIPRQTVNRDYSTLDLPDNVLVITDKDFYELMMYVDYHSTVYSTCALEAPSFGVQNIMINIDNLSRKIFGASLIDRITKYADTPEEYLNLIRSMDKLDKDTVYHLNEDIIMPNYRNNLKYALSQVLD
ncbi:MAG: hypothetical protein ACFFDT_14870 [Candidatus Hodarchaeota archaeon]